MGRCPKPHALLKKRGKTSPQKFVRTKRQIKIRRRQDPFLCYRQACGKHLRQNLRHRCDKNLQFVVASPQTGRKMHKFSGGRHSAFHRILRVAQKVAWNGLTNCEYLYIIRLNQPHFAAFWRCDGAVYCFLQAADLVQNAQNVLHFHPHAWARYTQV